MENEQYAAKVGDTVRAEMARRRLSQATVAEALGITQSALSRRMTGVIPFAVDELAGVASMMGLSVLDLIPADEKAAS